MLVELNQCRFYAAPSAAAMWTRNPAPEVDAGATLPRA